MTARQRQEKNVSYSRVHRVTNVTSKLMCTMNLHLSFTEQSSSMLPYTMQIFGVRTKCNTLQEEDTSAIPFQTEIEF